MDSKPDPQAEQPAQRDRVAPPGYYANLVRVRTTVWDLAVAFGVVRPLGQEVAPDLTQVDDVCTVSMSPITAKAFAQILAEQVAYYESKYGPIRPSLEPAKPQDSQKK